jgi:hypothetical protein
MLELSQEAAKCQGIGNASKRNWLCSLVPAAKVMSHSRAQRKLGARRRLHRSGLV